MTLEPGTQFGRYIINHQLGRGGMATVYRATDTRLQRTVALKIMAPALMADPEFVRRFEREAIMVANLHHPAIVTVYDIGEHNNLRYIAMEFIDGQSLNLVIRTHGALDLGMAVSLLDPVAQALDFAHAQGAVHRDVKPHNIMVASDGRVLLTDFGIAQASDSERERLTRTGIFMGTPEYISPEQAEGKRVDGRSDLYALGIVAYEILSGRVPFAGNTPQLIVAHIQSQPPPVTRGMPKLPPETNAVISRMLAKQPAVRYPTGAAFIAELHRIARQHSLPLASRPQLATLALPLSSAGKPTILTGGSGGTPTAQGGGVPPALAGVPAATSAAPSAQSSTTALPAYAPGEVARRRQPPRPAPTVARPATTPGQRKTPSAAASYQKQSRSRPPVTLIILVVLMALSVLLGFVAASARWGQGAGVPPTATANVPTAVLPTPITPEVATPVPPTDVPIIPPPLPPATAIPQPPSPTAALPATPIVPTDVPPPPTDVPPPPTDVPPPPTDVPPPPTDVPPPPTDVPPPPTDVPPPPTVIPLPSDTPLPPPPTDTPLPPPPTDTPLPPTPTDTPLPPTPTDTPLPEPTATAGNASGGNLVTPTLPPLIATDTPEAQ